MWAVLAPLSSNIVCGLAKGGTEHPWLPPVAKGTLGSQDLRVPFAFPNLQVLKVKENGTGLFFIIQVVTSGLWERHGAWLL